MAAFDRVSTDDWEQLARVLDAGVDELSAEQRALALERACRRLGTDELDAQDDEKLRVLWDELRAVVLRVMLERLVAKGRLEIVGVAGDGHLVYEPPARSR